IDAPATRERPTAPPSSIAALVKTSMPAVVGILAPAARAGGNAPFRDFLERMYGHGGSGPVETPVRGIGTGFFIRNDGLIATNGHVIEGATDITVQVGEDERVYRATLVGHDDATDLALLRIEGDKPFPVLVLGESDRLEVGEWVIAIGNPFGLSRPVTTGIVRSYMGISIQESMSAELAESFGVPGGKGVVVTDVAADGPAARAGLKVGDVITSFDGEAVVESYRLRWLTARTTPGKRVRVGV